MHRANGATVLLLAGLLSMSLSACASVSPRVDINGAVGLTVDADGRPIVVVEICHGEVTEVSIVGPNRDREPNVRYVDLTTAPRTTPFTLDVARPPSTWTGTALTLPVTDELHIASARSGPEQELTQVDFLPTDLVELQPGTVQWSRPGGTRRVSAGDFHRAVCDRHVDSG